ncbi:MAG: DNA-protecting protein DprA [Lachnospiraceae bacterium]|nr:DNA-protecting protein DprA [Lachnospiraceae bacterium]
MEAYWYWFCHELYLERVWARELLGHYGSPRAVFEAEEEDIKKHFPKKAVRYGDMLRRRREWEPEEAFAELQRKEIQFYSSKRPEFPSLLKRIPDSPLGLFVRGNLPREEALSVAVVGARRCSSYGRMASISFAGGLAEQGVQIVSGMAAGVDGYAHRGALDRGKATYAVLGCGVDVCYPRQNQDLYQAIPRSGGLISEYPPGTPPLSRLFPLRNRLISGLCQAILVVEARERSGSLITADLALEQGRDVFAVPGRVGDTLSEGCNRLISQGAFMALTPEGLLESLGVELPKKGTRGEKYKKSLESSELLVYSCLGLQAQHIEEICSRTGLSLLQTMKILVSLEVKGCVCEVRKNYYSREHVSSSKA